jgi:hypothetical protein
MAFCGRGCNLCNFCLEITGCCRIINSLNFDCITGRLLQVMSKFKDLDNVSTKSTFESHRTLRAWLEPLKQQLVFESSKDSVLEHKIAGFVFTGN